jgi:acetylornithine deacetylase
MPDSALLGRLSEAVEQNFVRQTAFLRKLVSMPSKRGAEAPCQDWLASEFAARGWIVDRYTLADVEISALLGFSPIMDADYRAAVQVVAALRAPQPKGRSLILQGHIDVVPEGPLSMWKRAPYNAVVEGDKLYGRGAQDMKSGVSCMVFALEALKSLGYAPAADVYVQTVSEEECTGNGALSTLARGYRADAALIPEPSNHTITREHIGVMWFRLRVAGEPVHVAHSETGTNAILSAYGLLQAFGEHSKAINQRAEAAGAFGGTKAPVKFNPGVIRGGDWPSSTPAWCEVDCRIGVLPGTTLAEARQQVLDVVAAASARDEFLAKNPPEVIWNGFQADGYVLEPGSEAESTLAAAHKAVWGAPMGERYSTAVNDTRFYGVYYGIPALCYGPTGGGMHGFNEWADLPSAKRTTLTIAAFIADWCRLRPLDAL